MLRARAANPRWIAGQMRHGYRGAAEIAETVDNFFAYAALADVVDDRAVRSAVRRHTRRRGGRNVSDRRQSRRGRGQSRPASPRRSGAAWTSRRNSAAAIMAAMREASMTAPARWHPRMRFLRCRRWSRRRWQRREDRRGKGIKGWCPGALRPMLSGDGLIARLRMRRRHCPAGARRRGSPIGRASGATG